MKLGLFSDVHYCHEGAMEGTILCSLSRQKLCDALTVYQKEKIDLLICLGDLCDVGTEAGFDDSVRCFEELMELIRASGLPFLFVTGNHDCLTGTVEEIEKRVGQQIPPCVLDTEEYRFICLDANFESSGKHFGPAGFDWKDCNLPREQLIFLKKALYESDKECIVVLHEPLDTTVEDCYRVNNADEIRQILEASGKVKLVLQGHMHEYGNVVENGIRYITVVGMCEGTDNRFMLMDYNEGKRIITLKELALSFDA